MINGPGDLRLAAGDGPATDVDVRRSEAGVTRKGGRPRAAGVDHDRSAVICNDDRVAACRERVGTNWIEEQDRDVIQVCGREGGRLGREYQAAFERLDQSAAGVRRAALTT